jgi:hypothetical protein
LYSGADYLLRLKMKNDPKPCVYDLTKQVVGVFKGILLGAGKTRLENPIIAS